MSNDREKINGKATDCIYWLSHSDCVESTDVGNKARTLARLFRAGVPVPDGFCISKNAHQEALKLSIPVNMSQPAAGDDLMAQLMIPPDIQSQILAAYRTIEKQYEPDIAVAVRSSALSEDLPTASFAGLYQTVLNVKGSAALLEAVLTCWASVSSMAISSYKSRFEERTGGSFMAIIVQIMVPADMAGVLFTVDPRNGDSTRIVVEMAACLGDQVVSGTMNPVRFAFHRQTGEIDKSFDSRGYLGEVDGIPVPWQELFRLALKTEALLQNPQDIEWAFHKGNFWILQSRPITSIQRSTARQVWTRANAGEILPEVVTPLTWSVFKPVLSQAGYFRGKSMLTIHWNWKHPNGIWPDSPRLFSGRAYMELGCVYASFANLPGVSAEILQKLLGFEFNFLNRNELPLKRPRWHIMDPYRALRYWMEVLGVTHSIVVSAKPWLKPVQSTPTPDLPSPIAILKRINQLKREASQVLALHIQCTSFAFSVFGLAHQIVKRNSGPDMLRKFEAGITTHYQNISTAQQMISIWDLAQLADSTISGRKSLFEASANQDVRQRWKQSLETQELTRQWDQFLARFGDRSTQEFELSVPHWDEDPTFILQTMRRVLESSQPDPRERLQQQQEDGKLMIATINDQILKQGGKTAAWFFGCFIHQLDETIPLRENLKYAVITRFNALRMEFKKLAEVLVNMKILEEPQDIFYLTHLEINRLISRSSAEVNSIRQNITQRKLEHQVFAQKKAADLIVTIDGKEMPVELSQNADQTVLSGIPCSLGLVTGPAYVLKSVETPASIPAGHLLVVPAVDPGLTPIFLHVGGLVTEVGGLLSHGATLAREFGIPAVVGIPHATEIIRNEQRITIDGFNGTVTLLNEE